MKQVRTARGLSQRQVSERMGLKSPSSVSMWESDENPPTLANLQKFAAVCEVPVAALIGDPPGPSAPTSAAA